jgi:hypothetical protein
MFFMNVLCFFLGFIAYPYINHLPFPNTQQTPVETIVEQKKPVDERRETYLQECPRYGFSRTECERFWDSQPS